jgi:hypothetical protein
MRPFTCTLLLLTAARAFAAEPASVAEAIGQGKVSLNVRLRYEHVAQASLLDANALTLRTRLGYTTAPLHGFKAMVEGENIVAADGDAYSQSGLNPAAGPRAVVADPETTELNQAFLAYGSQATTFSVGRQRLVLDNQRFIGDVGWRQNQQTYDAAVLQDKSLAKTTLTYAYLARVNRVFSDRHPQGKWTSDSHLLNASYAGLPLGTVTGYAYLLDFENSGANSCATYGVSLAGTAALDRGFTASYRIEGARQSDYGPNPASYSTSYSILEAGVGNKAGSVSLAHEVLGSNRNQGFRTPLATLHAVNGWADLFLTTPAGGLRDTFGKASLSLPADTMLTAFYHRFASARNGERVGTEWDMLLARKFSPRVSGLAKWADFRRDVAAFPNVRKLWLMAEYAY